MGPFFRHGCRPRPQRQGQPHLARPADGSSKETQITNGGGESNGRFSPDGSRIVYVANGQLWIAAWSDATGSLAPAVQLTNLVTGADAPLWSPDGQSLAFVSEIYPECSTGHIFDEACNQKASDDADHAPTKALIFDSLLYRHWNTYQGAKRSHILMLHVARAGYIYDLTPVADWGKNIIAPPFALGGSLGYAWAPDSKEFAFVLNADKVPAASTNNDIYTIDITQHDTEPATKPGAPHLDSDPATKPGAPHLASEMWDPTHSKQDQHSAGAWSPKKISTSPGSDDAPAYSPDGKYLAFRSQARAGYESDRFRLMLYDREKKTTTEPRPEFDGWFDEFTWSPDSSEIYFTSGKEGEAEIKRIAITDRGVPVVDLVSKDGEFGDIQVGPHNQLVAVRMTVSSPAELVTIDDQFEHRTYIEAYGKKPFVFSKEDQFKGLTHVNVSLLSQLDQSKMESFWFPGANGTKVEGFLIRPPNFDQSKKYPLKFLIHGGPQGAWGDAWSYRWNAELMAASGYVVVMINPRGSYRLRASIY